jgi:hypothetical protein
MRQTRPTKSERGGQSSSPKFNSAESALFPNHFALFAAQMRASGRKSRGGKQQIKKGRRN